jgi:hypothetical protein
VYPPPSIIVHRGDRKVNLGCLVGNVVLGPLALATTHLSLKRLAGLPLVASFTGGAKWFAAEEIVVRRSPSHKKDSDVRKPTTFWLRVLIMISSCDRLNAAVRIAYPIMGH